MEFLLIAREDKTFSNCSQNVIKYLIQYFIWLVLSCVFRFIKSSNGNQVRRLSFIVVWNLCQQGITDYTGMETRQIVSRMPVKGKFLKSSLPLLEMD